MPDDGDSDEGRPLYVPTMRAEYWSVIGDFVLAVTRDVAADMPYRPALIARSISDFVLWCWQAQGLPLDRDRLFTRANIAMYADQGAQNLTPAARGNRRSLLLGVAPLATRTLSPRLPPIPKGDATIPYSARDIVALMSWARGQSTDQRRANGHVLLALGLGAGLSAQEIIELRSDDVHRSHNGIDVHVQTVRPRVAPVLDDWSEILADTMPGSGDYAFRPGRSMAYANAISNFVARSRGPGLRPQSQRMRSTWIVRHLDDGVPVNILLQAAGVESLETFTRLIPFMHVIDPAEASSRLRGSV